MSTDGYLFIPRVRTIYKLKTNVIITNNTNYGSDTNCQRLQLTSQQNKPDNNSFHLGEYYKQLNINMLKISNNTPKSATSNNKKGDNKQDKK